MGVEEHKKRAPKKVEAGVLTVSSSRSKQQDKAGNWIVKQLNKEGHAVSFHEVAADDMGAIEQLLLNAVHIRKLSAIIVTGGTGVSPLDVTIEAVRPLFDKELTAFGQIFSLLSFEEIDSAAILSRATAGIMGQCVVFCIPGSIKACKLACKNLIFPELSHIVGHLHEAGN